MNLTLLSVLILWRLTAVFLVQTAYVPDEYWQSLEVAHRLAFGYGHLTWEWTAMIRSYTYPFLISILYRVLAALSLDFVSLLTTLPRVCQAVLAGYADYRFYKWTNSRWMLYMLLLNWFWYYCATRTLINSVETACTTIALSIFPWRFHYGRRGLDENTKFLWIVGLLCMARPTAAIIWLPLCLYHIRTSSEKRTLLARYAVILFSCFSISVSIDSYCYGTFVVTPWKFFQANVLGSVGNTYGTKHAFWYLVSGLSVLLGLYYVLFVFSVLRIILFTPHFQRVKIMLATIGWTLFVYSLLSHKEHRFVLPLLPLLICTGYYGLYNLRCTGFVRNCVWMLLILGNVAPGLYLSLVHQRGTLDAMKLLRDEISHANSSSTLILTPCHATPLYSHLHVNASMRFLTCEPNLDNVDDYVDEADRFFADPTAWLDDNYVRNASATLPTYVITFDNIASNISDFLRNYKPIAKIFHAHFPQPNYGEYVLLYKYALLFT